VSDSNADPTIRWLRGETLDRDRSPVTSPGEA